MVRILIIARYQIRARTFRIKRDMSYDPAAELCYFALELEEIQRDHTERRETYIPIHFVYDGSGY